MKKINLAILGLGNIGKGVLNLLEINRDEIIEETGFDFEITKVLEINEKVISSGILPKEIFTSNIDEIAEDSNIDIVIEVLGGIEPATSFVKICLRGGKSVVTSNKAFLAPSYNEILKIAKEEGIYFGYEASVGGTIPVIDVLRDSLSANKILKIMGILNGTTNFILTKMTLDNMGYEEALKEAQDLGFAEPDPTDDVTGKDVVNKLSILMNLAFDYFVAPDDIKPIGITEITKDDIEKARAENKVIKLVAVCEKEGEEVKYKIEPVGLPENHILSSVNYENNAILIEGNASGEIMLYGKGAGPLPTASAIMSDVIRISKLL